MALSTSSPPSAGQCFDASNAASPSIFYPAWSSDGRQIYFARPTAANSAGAVNYQIYAMDADGSHLRPLLSPTFGIIGGNAAFAWRPLS